MDVFTAAASLRSVRDFAPGNISSELVDHWIEAARWCGSSKNSQPWRFVAVRDRDTLRVLSGLGNFAGHLADCPVAVAVASTPSEFPFSTTFDLGRVAQTLMLLAHEDGVGSCVAVFEPANNVARAGRLLGAPEGYSVDFAISFGFPALEDAPVADSPSPRGRLDRSELLFQESFVGAGPDR